MIAGWQFLFRLVRGAAQKFSIRVSDWFAATVMLSFALAILAWPQLLHTFRYLVLLRIAPAYVWGPVCLMIGVGRIGALTVNGTFPSFPWSPHLRLLMAGLSAFVWFQITLGVLVGCEPTVMVAIFPQLFVFDLYNLYLAAAEAGAAERLHRHVGS